MLNEIGNQQLPVLNEIIWCTEVLSHVNKLLIHRLKHGNTHESQELFIISEMQ